MTEADTSEPVTQPLSQLQNKSRIKLIILICLLVVVSGSLFLALNNNQSKVINQVEVAIVPTTATTPEHESNSNTMEELKGAVKIGAFQRPNKTLASPKIMAVNDKTYKISLYDPATFQTSNLNVNSDTDSLSLSLSPAFHWIAYINKKDKNIWIIDSDGKNNTKISDQAKKESNDTFGTNLWIYGWSSNEKFIVYKVEINNKGGMGFNPKDKLNPQITEGYYIADLTSGQIYYLPGLKSSLGFIPGTTKIVFESEFVNNKKDLYTRDITTGFDTKLTRNPFKYFFTGQYSFSTSNIAYTGGGR